MYWISRYLDPWPWPIFHASVTLTNFTSMFHYHWAVSCMIRKVSAEDIAIRGNGTGPEYMCPTRHFVYIFFNPVFQVSTAKNEINLFNNHVLIVAPVTFAPAGAMTPSAEFLLIACSQFSCWWYGNIYPECGACFYTPVWKTGRIMLRGMASVRPSINFFVSG